MSEKTEAIARKIVAYVEAHPRCKRFDAEVARYSIKGNGYLYAAAGSIKMDKSVTKTSEIAGKILELIKDEPNISAEKIRSQLDICIIVFRCAMKLITDKVRKSHVNYKPHYRMAGVSFDMLEVDKCRQPIKFTAPMLTQWRATTPWAQSHASA